MYTVYALRELFVQQIVTLSKYLNSHSIVLLRGRKYNDFHMRPVKVYNWQITVSAGDGLLLA